VRVAICTLASQLADSGERTVAALQAVQPGVDVRCFDFLPESSGAAQRATRDEAFATKGNRIGVMKARAADAEVLEMLGRTDVLWFTGGDQRLILDTLRGTPFESAMMARWRAGALLVGGTSAGLQVCSEYALTGDFTAGAHTEAASEGDTPGEGDDTPLRRVGQGLVVAASGFPFLRGVVLDQHFIRRQRQNRLISACLDHPGALGLGVDESTALIVRRSTDGTQSTGIAHVVGESCVFYVDSRKVTPQAPPPCSLGFECGIVWEGGHFPFPLQLG